MFNKGDILIINGKRWTVIKCQPFGWGRESMTLVPGAWEEIKPGEWVKVRIPDRSEMKELMKRA